jgi:hypothetical protein
LATPHIKTAANPHPKASLALMQVIDPGFLARDAKGHQHQIWLQLQQLLLQLRPTLPGLVAINC